MNRTLVGSALAAALLSLALPLQALAAAPITVSGRVIGPKEQPIAAAEITVTALEGELGRGRRWLAQEAEPPALAATRTDAAGAFRIAVAEPVFALVTVRAPGFAAIEVPLEPLLESIELPTAQLARSREVTLRVTGGGKPLAGAWLAASPLGSDRMAFTSSWRSARRWGRTGTDGTLKLERGEDESVLVRAFAPSSGEVEREVVRGSALELQLPAASSFTIQLRGPGGQPVAGAVLFGGKGSWPLAQSDSLGKLAVPATLAATTVTARAPDGAFLETRLPPPKEPGVPVVIDLPAAARLAGRVLEAATRRPLPNAWVWPQGAGELAVRSRGDGGYEVRIAAPNSRLRAVAAGFLGADSWTVPAGATRGPTFALAAALAVGGTVVDEAGRPVAGAEIEPLAEFGPRLARSFSFLPPLRARARSDGGFELRGLEAGSSYGLRVTHADFAMVTVELPPTEPARPWPPQRIVLARGVGAFGRVLTGERQPVAGATVELLAVPESRGRMRLRAPDFWPSPFTTASGADGRFVVEHLPAGRYNLQVEARGFAPVTVPGVELAAVPPQRDLGTVVVGPGAALEGVVVDPHGLTLAEARVWALVTGSDAAMNAFFRGPEDEPQAVTGADGRFRIDGLRPGERVEVVVRRQGYSGGEAAGVEPPVAEPVRIVLNPAVRVSGRVLDLDGKGIAGAFVDHSLKRVRGNSIGWTTLGKPVSTDAEGRFAIDGVEPGIVVLFAHAQGFVAGNRDDLAVVAGRDLEGVEIVLRQGARVAGRVLDAAGEPVAGAQVMVEQSARSSMSRSQLSMSDGDGIYGIDGVEPGPRTLVARHDDGRRAAAELEVREGDNTLDLRLAGGVEVTGVVRDADGLALGGARIELIAGGRFWRPRETTSLADGSFVLTDVLEGAYQLRGESDGYAPVELPIHVASEPVGGLVLRLDRGGSIVGQVRGLEFAALSQVRLFASSDRSNSRSGTLDFQGRYRLGNLRPGTWQVQARLAGGGRSARGEVVLAEGQTEATLDLEFGEGWVLSGRVSSGGQPVAGATVSVRGRDVVGGGDASTSQAGDFRIQDLKSGSFNLSVQTAQGFVHGQEIALTADLELEIALATGEVRGVVLDSVDRAPIAGAEVILKPPPGAESGASFWRVRSTQTDSRGAFRISEVATGTWSVAAERSGYARAERIAVIGTGTDLEEIELELQPTEGVSLEVRGGGGRVPEMLIASVTDAAGRAVAGGIYTPTDTGRVRLRDVPAGSWEVLLNADDSAVMQIQVVVPGPAVPVALVPAATLELVVPGLSGSDLVARASLADPAGRPFRVPDWSGSTRSEWPMRGGRMQIRNLPAGAWAVTVVAPDGRTWSGTAAATAGVSTELKLESAAPR